MKDKKGFIISIIAVSLVLLLIMFVIIMHNTYLSSERAVKEPQPLVYSRFFFNDVFMDVKKIVGPNIEMDKQNNSIVIIISDTLPKSNFLHDLDEYKAFLENNFSSDINANISVDFSTIEDGTLELFFVNRYLYANNYTGDNDVLFVAIGNDSKTNASAYEIDLTTPLYRESIQDFQWDQNGDINVTIRYSDLNGTWESNGTLNSSVANTFLITFISNETRYVKVVVGKKDGREGVLWIKENNAPVKFSFSVKLHKQNSSDAFVYYYNAMLNYSQGKIRKSTMIGND
jgi:hypothetical protein